MGGHECRLVEKGEIGGGWDGNLASDWKFKLIKVGSMLENKILMVLANQWPSF